MIDLARFIELPKPRQSLVIAILERYQMDEVEEREEEEEEKMTEIK